MARPASGGADMTAPDRMAQYDDLYGPDEPLPAEPPPDDEQSSRDEKTALGPPSRPRRRTSWTADELMRTTFPPTRWAVRGLVSEGVNLLVGAPKLGKSWLALCIAIAIAAGGRALGRVDVEAGDVLYLALEDTGRFDLAACFDKFRQEAALRLNALTATIDW